MWMTTVSMHVELRLATNQQLCTSASISVVWCMQGLKAQQEYDTCLGEIEATQMCLWDDRIMG